VLSFPPFTELSFTAEPSFEFVAWQTEQGEEWIRLTGELDIASIDRLTKGLSSALASADSVVVDLRGLSFIDGAGLGALVSWRARAGAGGHRLALVRSARQFDALLAATGLEDLFDTVDTHVSGRPSTAPEASEIAQLHCPRCDLTIRIRAGDPVPEHCPRCLGRNGLEIRMATMDAIRR
jgi:anti-anti-sigma factor